MGGELWTEGRVGVGVSILMGGCRKAGIGVWGDRIGVLDEGLG